MGTVNFLANVVFIKFPSCGNLVCGGHLNQHGRGDLVSLMVGATDQSTV